MFVIPKPLAIDELETLLLEYGLLGDPVEEEVAEERKRRRPEPR